MTIGKLVEEANNAFDIKPLGYETTPERSIFVDGVIEGYAIRSKELNEQNEQSEHLEAIVKTLLDNYPDTYSGTNIDLQQRKMFIFQNAVNEAREFLNKE